jgi:hypothetical protein
MQPFRIDPQLPAAAMKTYQIVAPLSTHWRPATCGEVNCPNYLNGWKTVVDETTELGRAQAHYIRSESKRKFTVAFLEGGLTRFIFEAGQRCFAEHQARLDRPELYVVRDGDWRGNPRGTEPRRHARPADWVDDFANHQQRIAEQIQKG